jgi:hypothetical protein
MILILKWSPYFSMYQGGCGEASAWESVILESGTELSLNLNGVLIQCIREAVGRPQHGGPLLWRLGLSAASTYLKKRSSLAGKQHTVLCLQL